MKSYQEIREEELVITKDYSKKQLDRYIWSAKFFRKFLNEKFFWFLSILSMSLIWSVFIWLEFFKLDLSTIFIFVVSHFIYWFFRGRKDTIKLIDECLPELDLNIEVLEDIRTERNQCL